MASRLTGTWLAGDPGDVSRRIPERAMSELIVPPTLAAVLAAFTTCFQARSVLIFQWLVVGWIQCQGRRTITAVTLASGALGHCHISVFRRFFSRASWSLD